jgi:acetolactate synthase-1/2/3 large subunit
MSEMSGADAIVESLVRHDVDTVFGLPGVQMYGLFDAFARNTDRIRVINARHEQTVAYMAMGYAYATGKPAVFTVVPGPGVLNTMAALCTAQAVNVQILCLAGQVPSASIGRGRGALHEIPDQLATIRSLLKWAQRIEHPTQASDLVALAFREMASGRPGPVALEIAPDVLTAIADVTIQDPLPLPASIVPDPAAIARIADLLNASTAPMLMVGGGALNASREIRELAEKLGAPVLANRAGRGVMDDRHPLSVNAASAWALWQDTDAIVGVGTRMDTQRYGGFGPGMGTARIDIDPAAMRRLPVDIGMVADSAAAVAALLPLVHARADGGRTAASITAKAGQREDVQSIQPQVSFVDAIRESIPDDAIFVDEMTQVGYAAAMAYPAFAPRTYITQGYSGTLGAGFPTALGVKVGQPDKVVVSITGDGGFLFAATELATARHHDIDLITVLVNNHAYYNVMRDQRRIYDGRDSGSSITNPDFQQFAASFGVPSWQVKDAAGLRRALSEAIAAGGPALIEVVVEFATEPSPFFRPPKQ